MHGVLGFQIQIALCRMKGVRSVQIQIPLCRKQGVRDVQIEIAHLTNAGCVVYSDRDSTLAECMVYGVSK